jgi:isopenicillin N synthase-like dioxygenase
MHATIAGEELPRSTQLSCGEHTDYGLLTMVNQDEHVAALQVHNCLLQISSACLLHVRRSPQAPAVACHLWHRE